MANFRCNECGLEARSKCPSRRTVFPRDQMVATLSHKLQARQDIETAVLASGRPGDVHELEVKFHHIVYSDEEDDTLERFLDIMRDTDKEQLRQVFCQHSWEILKGECLFGCHVADDSETEN